MNDRREITVKGQSSRDFDREWIDNQIMPIERKGVVKKSEFVFMRRYRAEIDQRLPPEMLDAEAEIEFCHRYSSGEFSSPVNIRTYGIITSGDRDAIDEKAKRLRPAYLAWKETMQKHSDLSLAVTLAIVIDGMSLRQAMSRFHLRKPDRAASLLMHGLNEYCIARGWGDIINHYKDYRVGYCYIIGGKEAKPPHKIGYSADPLRRLTDIQIGNPLDLILHFILKVGERTDQRLESKLHKHFANKNIRGEWFDVDLEEVKDVMRLLAPHGIEISIDQLT